MANMWWICENGECIPSTTPITSFPPRIASWATKEECEKSVGIVRDGLPLPYFSILALGGILTLMLIYFIFKD